MAVVLKQRERPLPCLRFHREHVFNHVPQRIAQVGALAVGFVDLGKRVPAGISSPVDLFKIGDQLHTARIDTDVAFIGVIPQSFIDTGDPVFHCRVFGTAEVAGTVLLLMPIEKGFDNLPIRLRGGAFTRRRR